MNFIVIRNDLGRYIGVQRGDDGAFIPCDPGNRDYRGFLDWNAVQHLDISDGGITRRVPRNLGDIATDLSNLSSADKNTLSTAMTTFLANTNAQLLFFLKQMLTLASLSQADKNNLKLQMGAVLIRDNPTFATDLGINVPGDQLAS